jgi:hypothetical protein
MEAVVSKARGTKVYIGSGAGNPKDTEYWIRQGVDWILFATDYALMRKAAVEFARNIRSTGLEQVQ